MTQAPPVYTPRPPRNREERLARIYDEEIYPLVARRLDELLLRGLVVPAGAQVLELGCGGGAATSELLARSDANTRIMALEDSSALLELARDRTARAHPGRRTFWKTHRLGDRLPFGDDHFEVTLADVTVGDVKDPAAFLSDLVRVTKPGGQVVVASLVRGSWTEFLDIFHDVLTSRGKPEPLAALEAHLQALPDGESIARALEGAGLAEVDVELDHWELLFRSARELLYAPVVEHGPLERWKEIAGKGAEMQETFLATKEAIETYFGGRTFAVTLQAAGVRGKKPVS